MNSNMDKRTLVSMLKLEENYIVRGDYFNDTIKPEMRSKLATWMLEVCEEQECTDEVNSNAMNIFDRLMCVLNNVEVYHLQLLGSVCLFISSKLSSSQKLTAVKLVDYTDNSITLEDLLEWELFAMDKIHWDVCSIVPNEFVDLFLQELNLDHDMGILKKHCYAFTAMCATDFKFSKYPSSMIASACILNALSGLDKLEDCSFELNRLALTLNNIANIDIEFLVMIKEQVSDLFKQSAEIQQQDYISEEPQRVLDELQIEDEYDFDIDFNMNIDDNIFDNLAMRTRSSMSKSVERQNNNGLAKTLILSPAPSSPASSSGVSSSSSLLSPSLLQSSYYTNQEMVSMLMITPPLANSLPMPEFDRFESQITKKDLRRSSRHSQRLIRC